MKLHQALLCLCLPVLAAPASAQQLFLNHDNCASSPLVGAKNKHLNCASTTDYSIIVTSLVLPTDIPNVIASLGVLHLLVGTVPDPANMPDFWEFNSGGCSGTNNFNYHSNFDPFLFSDCADLWFSLASGGGQYRVVGNRARVTTSWGLTPLDARLLIGGAEQYISWMVIRNTSAGVCTGCNTPVCVVYNEEAISEIGGSTLRVTNPDHITFNDPGNLSSCPGATPTRNNSWGQVKALYR
jgi:hypothetical protein